MNARLSELPYFSSTYEAENLLGHGTTERKLVNADAILASEDFDSVYKLIASVHKQNMLLERMLDNDEDQAMDEVKPPVRRRAAPKKKAAPKRVPVSKLGDPPAQLQAPAASAATA